MNRLLLLTGLLCSCLTWQTVSAQETVAPVVRAKILDPEVSVGEPVRLQVEVLVPTWFPRPPVYPAFELANAITRLPPDSSYPTSERVGNETWSGILREYEIYPLIGATFKVEGETMRVIVANPPEVNPPAMDVDVPAFEFRSIVPEGAESLAPYLAGDRLTLTREVTGETEGLAAGDAIVLTYRAELDGLLSLFLPDLAPKVEAPGISVYADQPVFEDDGSATRTERVTLVFDSGGEFTVPESELQWWNRSTQSIETVAVPELRFSVVGPQVESEAVEVTRPAPLGAYLLGAVVVLGVGFLVLRWGPGLRLRQQARREARLKSEAYLFDSALSTIRQGDPHAAYQAVLTWLNKLDPGLSGRAFAAEYGGIPLVQALDCLAHSLFGEAEVTTPAVDCRDLATQLSKARRQYRAQTKAASAESLPSLNP